MRSIWLIARTALLEAVRRREIYVIVLVSLLLIGAVLTVDFFHIEGLTKFYREMALKIMSAATALTVIALAARQLPREFESRTIYPLLAKPVSRTAFLLGKLLGILLAAVFCFALFMSVFVAGSLYLGARIPWALFLQFIYLQILMMLVLATLCFWFSMFMNLDATVTLGVIFYATSTLLTTASTYLYYFVGRAGQIVLTALVYIIPQLSLFDLSGKATHSSIWAPLGIRPLVELTLYGGFYAALFFFFALILFRRRAL